MKKKIVFFDGDGTLWYPKTTRYSKAPHWVYTDERTKHNPNEHLELTPHVVETLMELRRRNVKTVILSANPFPPREAYAMMNDKVEYFGISNLFDEVHATPPRVEAKGEFILGVLSRYGLNKKDALMVGDIYLWDCKSAKDVGVEALLIESEYRKKCPNGRRARRIIKGISEVLDYL